jgi:hypothetical protein
MLVSTVNTVLTIKNPKFGVGYSSVVQRLPSMR